MNFELSKEQSMIKKSALDFAKSVLEPIAYDDDRSARYPKEAVTEMGGIGYMGLLISKEYGGNAADMTSMVAVAEAFGKYNAAAAAILANHNIAAAQTIEKYGSDDQKENYLPMMASGNLLGGYAFAEPGAAITSGADKAVAVKDSGSYKISGKKTFAANGGEADVYVVIAQTDEELGPKGISAFIVEKSEIKAVKKIDKLGLRAFPTAEITFEDAKASILGAEKDGPKIMADINARMDIVNGAMASGVASTMLEACVDYSKIRVQFGAPIAKIQAVQWMMAEIAEAAHLIEMTVYAAAGKFDTGGDYAREAAYSKIYAMKASQEAGMNAVQIHGGSGYSREDKIERYFRDIRGAYNIENSSEYPQKVIVNALIK